MENPERAFPGAVIVGGECAKGMTLRDYFAGQAIIGLISNAQLYETPEENAIAAYDVADAMLEARDADEQSSS